MIVKAVQQVREGLRKLGHREYVLFIFMLVFAIQYLDRQVIVVLSQPIKEDFGLSDSQMGLLTGFVFSVPYCLMLLPVGLLVDRWNRRNLLLIALTIWSSLTIVTGFVRSLWELMVIRATIAAAELTNNPTALSMISDLYDRKTRGTAVGIFYAGPAMASFIGFVVIAAVADRYGWRAAFFAAGAPGLLLGLLLFLTIREPAREGSDLATLAKKPTLRETAAFIRTQRSMVHLMLAMMATAVISSGQLAWMVPSLMRGQEMSLTEAALAVSLAFGAVNAFGHLVGGAIVDRWAARDVRWFAWAPAIFAAIGGVCQIGSAFSPNSTVAIALLALWALPIGFQYGPVMGAVQSLAKPRMRGVAGSALVFLVNLIGAGGGPLLVGMLSDRLMPLTGQHSLQWSLALVSTLQLWAIFHFVRAARTIRPELARVAGLTDQDA